MNVGEKIVLYKERLGFKNYQEFGKAVGISGDWINEISKKTELKAVDMNNLIKLCEYLSISVEELVTDDERETNKQSETEISNINATCDDISVILNELILLIDKDNIKMDGMLLNAPAKKILRDSIDVVRILAKQYL